MKTLRKALCLAIALIMLCMTACSAQKEPENLARTVEVPYGKDGIATVEFNEKGLVVAEKNMPYDYDFKYVYDEENRITEKAYFSYDVERNGKDVFEYYSDGKLKRVTSYNTYENQPINYEEYIYDNDRIEKVNFYDYTYQNGYAEIIYTASEEYSYAETEDGLVVISRNVAFEGSYGESTSTYDKNGKLIFEEYSGGAGSTEYIYDEEGNLIKEIQGDDEIVYEYEYENGLLSKETCVKDVSGNSYSREGEYKEYKYFDNGNIKLIYWYGPDGYLAESNACIMLETSDEAKGNYSEIADYLY